MNSLLVNSLKHLFEGHILLNVLFHHFRHCHLEVLLGYVYPPLSKSKHASLCANSL